MQLSVGTQMSISASVRLIEYLRMYANGSWVLSAHVNESLRASMNQGMDVYRRVSGNYNDLIKTHIRSYMYICALYGAAKTTVLASQIN